MSAPSAFFLLARVPHARPPEKTLQRHTVSAETFFYARARLATSLRIAPECIRLDGQGEPPEHVPSPSEVEETRREMDYIFDKVRGR